MTTLLLAVAMILSMQQSWALTVFTIGDSTMANKSLKDNNQERGWGMVLPCYFSDEVKVENHAVNGRSTKSFIDEGRWQTVLDRIQPGDYVFIQFGHNDEKPNPDRHTDPGSTFDDNLRRFVNETRAKGGIPVLFNCVVRRNFAIVAPRNDDDEALRSKSFASQTAREGDTLVDTHGDFAVAPRLVANEMNVPFVDANRITHDLEQGLGPMDSRNLHMWFYPGDPRLPKGRQDNTHYNVYGAHCVASLLVDEIGVQVPALKKYVRHYDLTVATDGSATYFNVQDAVDAAPAGKTSTIMVGSGEWTKPIVPHYKKVRFVMRKGASWKK